MKKNVYYNLQQVAEQLGVSRNTLLNWKSRAPQDNPIIFIKLGNHWKISHENLEKWITSEQNRNSETK